MHGLIQYATLEVFSPDATRVATFTPDAMLCGAFWSCWKRTGFWSHVYIAPNELSYAAVVRGATATFL